MFLYEKAAPWKKCAICQQHKANTGKTRFRWNLTSSSLKKEKKKEDYHNDPKFSDRYAWANRADPDQTAPESDQGLHCLPLSSLIRVYTVCHSVCIVWTHYSMVEPHSSSFRVITTNFWCPNI